MLYPRKDDKQLDIHLFENPSAEYRGTPFWSWNCALDADELVRQIHILKEMGFGGFHMHSRTGMDTPYLTDAFFDLIETCVKTAKAEHMLAWAYDEDRWPSGFAGGIVTKNKAYRQCSLVFSPEVMEETELVRLIQTYRIQLDDNGHLIGYIVAPEADEENWFAYEVLAGPDPWHNDECYVNTLSKEAIDCFCDVTHEAYRKRVGDSFGTTIPAFFTDEPQFTKKSALGFSTDRKPVMLPWSPDFEETFSAANGVSLIAHLPELFWDFPEGQFSAYRYQYHNHVSNRFAEAFAENVGAWCEQNGLVLTGHMMEEPTLKSQTASLGEVMRSLSAFGLPGVDMLCDRREFTTVKQAASVAHQYGREGVLSESYGVTGWEFDFRGHKLQSDWQAALGVTVRAPHLSWVSMGGEAKRDYPASINYQVPWYKQYSLIEDHFARVNTAMVRGKPKIKVAVVHPVESYWLYWGPQSQSADVRAQLDDNFKNITEWLLFGLVDFDYISESLLPSQCQEGCFPLTVGQHAYDVVIIPGCKTLRSTTWERLKDFAAAGGRLIIAGDMPICLDAKPDTRVQELLMHGKQVNFDRHSILKQVEDLRDVAVYSSLGYLTGNLLYQLREDGDNRFLFLAHGKHPRASEESDTLPGRDVLPQENIQIVINGHWQLTQLDTLTGKTITLAAQYKAETTVLNWSWYPHDSLLLFMEPGQQVQGYCQYREQAPYRLGRWAFEKQDAPTPYWDAVPYSLSEPNVLVLDIARYALDAQPYRPADEILRLDNILRAELGLPPRQNGVVQPWVIPHVKAEHVLRLQYTIISDIALSHVQLGVEDAATTRITWNGHAVSAPAKGFYVDKAISVIPLPGVRVGENVLELELPFGARTNSEACFLLGNFGVSVCGIRKRITALPDTVAFGDITTQGLPFYGGNITYHVPVVLQKGDAWIRVPLYRGALVGVAFDGIPQSPIAFSPYQVQLTGVEPGAHQIDLTLYGNRQNTFGALHNANERWWWHGPDAYRVFRDEWSYGYQLSNTGILKSPEVFQDARYAK